MVATRDLLLQRGQERIDAWLAANGTLPPVDVQARSREDWRVSACAYYRENVIYICPAICATPGYAGRAWSWPGYAIDHTPYGVLAHELGHHVDWHSPVNPLRRGRYWSDLSSSVREHVRKRFNTIQPELPWREVLAGAPERTISAAERKAAA